LTLGPGARRSTAAQRWLARLSFLLAALAVVILVIFAELNSLAILAVGLGGAAVSLMAAYFFLSRRGVRRWLSLGVRNAPIGILFRRSCKMPCVASQITLRTSERDRDPDLTWNATVDYSRPVRHPSIR
jgi:hypothetical protein